MPNSYSNKDLSRFKRTPAKPEDMEVLSETMREPDPSAQEPSVEALLAAAKGSLGRADKFAQDTGSADIASIPDRLARINDGRKKLPDPIDMLATGSIVPGMAAMFPTPASPALGALSGLMAAPAGIRTMLAAEDTGDLAWGAAQTGLSAFPVVGGMRAGAGAAQAGKAAQMADDFPRVLGGRASSEMPYASAQRATNPNQALGVARELAEETGQTTDQILRGSSKAQPKASVQALQQLNASGMVGQAGRLADDAASEAAAYTRAGVPQKSGVDPRDFTDFGGRTNSGFAGPTPEELAQWTKKHPLPNDARYMSEVDDLAKQAGLSSEFDDFAVQAVPDVPSSAGNSVPPSMKALKPEPAMAKPKPPVKRSYFSSRVKNAAAKSGRAAKASLKALLPQVDDAVLLGSRSYGE